jgi:hypothetical protein
MFTDSRYGDWSSERHANPLTSTNKGFSGTQNLMGSGVGNTSNRDPWAVPNERKSDSAGAWGRNTIDSGNSARYENDFLVKTKLCKT